MQFLFQILYKLMVLSRPRKTFLGNLQFLIFPNVFVFVTISLDFIFIVRIVVHFGCLCVHFHWRKLTLQKICLNNLWHFSFVFTIWDFDIERRKRNEGMKHRIHFSRNCYWQIWRTTDEKPTKAGKKNWKSEREKERQMKENEKNYSIWFHCWLEKTKNRLSISFFLLSVTCKRHRFLNNFVFIFFFFESLQMM